MVTKLQNYNLSTPYTLTPKISSILVDNAYTSVLPAGNQTVVITGSGFMSGAQVHFGLKSATQVTVDSSTQITCVAPSNTSGKHWLTVTNANGVTAKYLSGIDYSGFPDWVTAAGSLGTVYDTSKSTALTLSVTTDYPTILTYDLISGQLPSGISFNIGDVTHPFVGNFPVVSTSTTYDFELKANTGNRLSSARSFSLTLLPDSITWVTPTYQQALVLSTGSLQTITLSTTTLSNNPVTYTVTGLPDGLSYSNGVISGTPATPVSASPVTITASFLNSARTFTNVISIQIDAAPSQVAYTTPGTYTWIAPLGVTSVCAVCVGGGGGGSGGGGGLGWKNNIAVVPGTGYTVVVGAGGASFSSGTAANAGDSYFINATTVKGGGGFGGASLGATFPAVAGGSYVGQGGGNGGGVNAKTSATYFGGGGGAGGYSGNGGTGGQSTAGTAGAGGGGGGGGGDSGTSSNGQLATGGGGGVGIFGQGTNGTGGALGTSTGWGASGTAGSVNIGDGVAYGGGDGMFYNGNWGGAGGAVRILWGVGRAFPTTNVLNV